MIPYRPFIPVLLLFCLPCILWGCIAAKAHRPVDPGAISLSPEAILEKFVQKNQIPEAFQAIARFDIETPEGRHILKAALMIKRPDLLRIESLPVMGPPDLIVIIRGDRLEVFLTQRGEIYEGKASRENLVRFLPVGLEKEELLAFLAGTTPDPAGHGSTLTAEPEGELYRIDVKSADRITKSLRVDPVSGLLLQVDVLPDGGRMGYSAGFGDFVPLEGTVMPRKLTLLSGGPDRSRFTVRYDDIAPVSGIDEGTFDIVVSEGVRRISLDKPSP
jgi:outer membrane lipoprotein-sorting protein